MLIDWFTVAAQAVNFLLLVWLLQRFLYQPIVRTMRQRQERIATDLDQAAEAREQARIERSLLEEERRNILQERERVLREAEDQARTWRELALARAREEVAAQRAAWQRSLRAEQLAFAADLRLRITQTVLHISREALADLADDSLAERLVAKLLREMPENGYPAPESALLRMGFEPGEPLQEQLRQALQQRWAGLRVVEFERAPDLGFGLECVFGNHKIQWNIDHYLAELEDSVLTVFSREQSAWGEGEPGPEEKPVANGERHGT